MIDNERNPITNESIKQKIAEDFLTALRTRDWDLMRTLLLPESVWSLPGSSQISGEAQGVDAVISRSQLITSYGLNFALKYIHYGPSGFVLSLNNTAKRGDLVLDEHLATVFQLENQKIKRIDTYMSDVSMANTFFE